MSTVSSAGRPVFASLEANLAPAVTCQRFVGAVSWRDSRRNLIAAFQSWALNATAAAPAVFDAFAANCLDRAALFEKLLGAEQKGETDPDVAELLKKMGAAAKGREG